MKLSQKHLNEWAKQHGVRFNPKKYAIMHMQDPTFPADKTSNELPKIENLPQNPPAKSIKILGVMVDRELTWDKHVEYVGSHRSVICTLGPERFANAQRLQIEQKVKKRMSYSKSLSTPTEGLDLLRNRHIYLTRVLPSITHACSAWFVRLMPNDWRPKSAREAGPLELRHWSFSERLLKRLSDLEYTCLKQVVGATKRERPPKAVIYKDLDIEEIRVHLHRLAVTHRASRRNTPQWEELRQRRMKTYGTRSKAFAPRREEDDMDHHLHPFHALDIEAGEVFDEARNSFYKEYNMSRQEKRDRWATDLALRRYRIKSRARIIFKWAMDNKWAQYCDGHATTVAISLAQRELEKKNKGSDNKLPQRGKKAKSLKAYTGLSRPQSTILFQLRSGWIYLKDRLFQLSNRDYKVCTWKSSFRVDVRLICSGFKPVDDPFCQLCRKEKETIDHLFFECTALTKGRDLLMASIGYPVRLNTELLLTKYAYEATAWAILYFPLKQFVGARRHFEFKTPSSIFN